MAEKTAKTEEIIREFQEEEGKTDDDDDEVPSLINLDDHNGEDSGGRSDVVVAHAGGPTTSGSLPSATSVSSSNREDGELEEASAAEKRGSETASSSARMVVEQEPVVAISTTLEGEAEDPHRAAAPHSDVDTDTTKATIKQQQRREITEASSSSDIIEEVIVPVPVTILTGFLGSGKTTLVSYILNSPDHGKRIAVIENEFAASAGAEAGTTDGTTGGTNDLPLSVETMIAKDGTSPTLSSLSDFIELPNGCICCTVKDSLVETLESLISKRSDLDYIIIECSGMANPGPIASIFWLDETLECRLRLDGIVTLVDAKHIAMQLQETRLATGQGEEDNEDEEDGGGGGGGEAAQQIAYADRILINKIDLLGDGEGATSRITDPLPPTLESVLDSVRSINPSAPYRTTTYSRVPDLDWILDANCFDVDRARDVELSYQRAMEALSEEEDGKDVARLHDHDHSHHHHDNCGIDDCDECHDANPSNHPPSHQVEQHHHANTHAHTSSIRTITLYAKGSVDLRQVNSWLASILWPEQDVDNRVMNAKLDALEEQERQRDHQEPPEPQEYIDKDEMNVFQKKSGTMQTTGKKCMRILRLKGILSVRHPPGEDPFLQEGGDDDNENLKAFFVADKNDMFDHVDEDEAARQKNADSVSGGGYLDKRRYIVQAVNDLWDVRPSSTLPLWFDDSTRRRLPPDIAVNEKTSLDGGGDDKDDYETRCCKIVVIGRHLDRADLERGFSSCLASYRAVPCHFPSPSAQGDTFLP